MEGEKDSNKNKKGKKSVEKGKDLSKKRDMKNSPTTPTKLVQRESENTPTAKNLNMAKEGEASNAPSSPTTYPSSPATSMPSEVIGYVHILSSPIPNKRKTMKYSTCVLQTQDKEIDTLLYSPRKRAIISESEKTRTPIKIRKFTFTPDCEKLIINDMTNISKPTPTEYCFQYNKLSSRKCISLKEVLESSEEGDLVSVIGKFGTIGEISNVGRGLKLAEATLADTTAQIDVSLFEENIASVKSGSVYMMRNLRVRVWKNVKKLTTTPSSIIVETENTEIAEIDVDVTSEHDETELTVVVPFITSVEQIELYRICVQCSKKLLQATASLIVKCDRCTHSMVLSNCEKKMSAHITVANNNPVTLMVLDHNLRSLISNMDEMSEEQIIETLLLLNNVSIKYDPVTLIVSEIKLH
ncbi:Hypothetical predicted protein [Paramuricea clavata]|uniref:Uncharacterized protein n=1 Tax=Paramuricea clavata TaxID=317549 RepID=A0A6S7I5N2_PARCT|nr:Hypothetical predicted protein [Paramuricea clavata]